MFTGIVEALGTVDAIEGKPAGATRRLTVKTGLDVAGLPAGASLAVDGVCLTVVDRGFGRFAADLGPETLACTTLGALRAGDRVHLERPLKMGDALGGHFVTGHVDGVGSVATRTEQGDALTLEIAAPAEVARTLVPKGSVTVDGVSLTVNEVRRGGHFSVTLIPHTLAVTHLGACVAGTRVNLEGDVLAKHVDRLLEARLGPARGRVAPGAGVRPPRPRVDKRKIRLPRKQPW